jgi:ArsR family metal-binding transcriptional regulator
MNRVDLNIEKQQGLVIKLFKSNDPDFLTKISNIKFKNYYTEISIKIFSNCKINIESVLNIQEAELILNFIKMYIKDSFLENEDEKRSEYYSSDEYY